MVVQLRILNRYTVRRLKINFGSVFDVLLNHAINFTKAGFFQTLKSENSPILPIDIFMQQLSPKASAWRIMKMETLYSDDEEAQKNRGQTTDSDDDVQTPLQRLLENPMEALKQVGSDDSLEVIKTAMAPPSPQVSPQLTPATPSLRPKPVCFAPAPATPQEDPSTHTVEVPDHAPTVNYILTEAMFDHIYQGARPNPEQSQVQSPDPHFDASLGLTILAFWALLGLCGLTQGLDQAVPDMWKKLGEKGIDTPKRNRIIKQTLCSQVKYPCYRFFVCSYYARFAFFQFIITLLFYDICDPLLLLSQFCLDSLCILVYLVCSLFRLVRIVYCCLNKTSPGGDILCFLFNVHGQFRHSAFIRLSVCD